MRGRAEGVFGLVNGVGHELPGVPVLQAVVDLGAFLAGGDHARQPHLGQMLGDRSRRFPGLFGQHVDGQFTVAQCQDEPDPGGVGQHGKHLHGQLDVLAVRGERASLVTVSYTHLTLPTILLV